MYDFDKLTDRMGSDCCKWDVKPGELPMWIADMNFAVDTIKEAKEAIAELEYNGNGKLNKEAAIAKKEAEIAAIEAELKIRQAEFEAELAELEALVAPEEEGEEEVPAE